MKRADSKYFKTAVMMDEALIRLLEKKDLQFITVKEICAEAGVNRSTFYLHYDTIGNILEETLDYIMKEFLGYFSKSPEQFMKELETLPGEELVFISEEYLCPYLRFISEHRNVFKAAYTNPGCMDSLSRSRKLKEYVIHPVMAKYNVPEDEMEYWDAFYINGIMGIIQVWVDAGCKDEIERVARIIIGRVLPSSDKKQ